MRSSDSTVRTVRLLACRYSRGIPPRARAVAARDAVAVLHHAGHVLVAGPWVRTRRWAVLRPIFLRQSHAERDLAALGKPC
jgi:hypothetical protein